MSFPIWSSVQTQWRQTGKSSEDKGSRGDQGMRSFHNRKLKVFSPPLVFLIILPCSPKAMIVPCKHLTRHECQCRSAILIQEFISLCVCRSPKDCVAWQQARPSHREHPMCSSWRGRTAYGKTKSLFQKQSWMTFNLAYDMTFIGGNVLPQALAAGPGIRAAPMGSSFSPQQGMVSTRAEMQVKYDRCSLRGQVTWS